MNQKEALTETFSQTFLGLIIGWGGFSTLVPNIMEALSGTVDLGSFRSLRVFSIVFFVVPVYAFIVYWWLRGNRLYVKYLIGKSWTEKPYYNVIVLASIGLNLLPIALFIGDEFFYTRFRFATYIILFYYCFLSIAQFLYFSFSWKAGQRGWKVDPDFVKANFLVFSLQYVLGVVFACFVKPWMIYKSNIGFWILAFFLLYTVVGLYGYFNQRIVNERKERINEKKMMGYKHFCVSVLVIFFFLINFPLVSVTVIRESLSIGFLAIIILTLMLLAAPFTWGKSFKNISSIVIGTICFSTVLIGLQIGVMDDILYKTNRSYIKSRFAAHKEISTKKIVPFLFMVDSVKGSQLRDLYGPGIDQLKMASFIRDKNRYLAAFKNDRTADASLTSMLDFDSTTIHPEINLINVLESIDGISVRDYFFKKYVEVNSDEFFRDLNSQEQITNFYNEEYSYIEDTLVQHFYEASLLKENFSDYFHPINYYAGTLSSYKNAFERAELISRLSEEYHLLRGFELPHLNTNALKIEQEIDKELYSMVEFRSIMDRKGDSTLRNAFYDKLWGEVKDETEVSHPLFDEIVSIKSKHYLERYKRAQIIFKAYLLDSQRPGLFLLFFSLSVLGLLYWIHKDSKPTQQPQEKEAPDELPGGFLNIAVVVLLVITVHIARPIKAENINPEKPYWMMDLNNWYDVSSFAKLLGDEGAVRSVQQRYSIPSSDNNVDQLILELQGSNEKLLQSNEDILQRLNGNLKIIDSDTAVLEKLEQLRKDL